MKILLNNLADSQSQLSKLLGSLSAAQDWQPAPDQWSFRFLAAHLATAEEECFQDRIQRIMAGQNPSFEYYENTGWDFSDLDLEDSLKAWRTTRLEIFKTVRDLPEEAWSFSGIHAINGPITIRDALVSMLEHDQEHWEELQKFVILFREGRPG